MRKQDKFIVGGGIIGAAGAALFDIWLQSEEQKRKGCQFNWESFDGYRTFKHAGVGAVAGGIIGNEIYKLNFKKECNSSFSSDRFIKEVLKKENVKSNPEKHKTLRMVKNEVKETLYRTFTNDLVAFPEDVGSLVKGTALASTYDGDIVVAVRKQNSFGSLAEMSTIMHNRIEKLYGGKAVVTKKRKATNILFNDFSTPVSIDIVYGRETGNYTKDRKLNLYVRPDYFWQSGTYFKTDINIQKNILINKPKVREVVKLFKLYFKSNGLSVENVLIDQLVAEAMSCKNYGTDSSVTENLLNCMEYISLKLNNNVIRDYANSNNNLLQKIDTISKTSIITLMNSDLKKIELNQHYIRDAFHY